MTAGVLQVGWFTDPAPADLPVWLIALGLEAVFLGVVWQVVSELSGFEGLSGVERLLGVGGTGLGYLFLTLSVLRSSYGVYAAFLFLLFRGVEGVAGVHLLARILAFLRGGGLDGNLGPRVRHLLVVFFVTALGSYLVVKGLLGRPVVAGVWYDVAVVYTVGTAVLAFLAVRWRFRDVADEVNPGVTSGLALCIAGAQVFGFSLAGDVLLTLAGSVVYSAGYWVGALSLFGWVVLPGRGGTDCPDCGADIFGASGSNYCPHCGGKL